MKGEHDVLRFSLMVSAVMEDFLGGFYQKALSLNENLTQGYTDKDDALLYMGKYPDYSDELRDLNDRGMGAGGFPIPELRLFGVDGVTTLGNPRNRVCEWKYSGDMANMFSGFVPGANLLEQVCGMGMHVFGDYDDGVSNTQIFGNGALAGGGTIAGLNLNEHGSLVVPLKSSTAAGVELYRKGNAKKKVYAIESEDIGQIGGWVIGGTATAIATYALLRTIGGFTHTSASLLAGIAGAAVAATGTLISSDDIGQVLETSHDYATKHSWKKNSRKIDGTDLEEFLYEKPFLSIAALKDNEGRLYPKIFTDTVPGSMNRLAPREVMGLSDWCDIAFEMGDAAINVAFCRQDPIGEWSRHWMGTVETAAPIDFGRSYPSALALKSEQYDPVRCVDEGACTARYGEPSQGTRPKVRRSSYYDYSATMLTETPEEIHLVVDDLRPDLLRSVSLDFNFSHQFVWKLDEDRNSCSLAYHGTWTEADTVLERGQCPVDAYGNWVLRPGELARKVNADFGAKDLIRDGQNTLSFSLTNKVGLAHSQRVYMLRQAVPPRLDLMWPRMGAVLSERCPEFSTLLDLVQYPGLSDGVARWRILKDEVDAQQEWALFGRPDTLWRSVGGKAESLYLFRGSCGQEPLPEGAYLYAAEIGSTAATGQQGKSFTLSTPFKIDVSAPEIALAVAPSAMMPPFVVTDKDSLIADLEWSDAANLRAAVFEVVSSDGHRVHSEVALWPAGPVALRWNGKGCSGGALPGWRIQNRGARIRRGGARFGAISRSSRAGRERRSRSLDRLVRFQRNEAERQNRFGPDSARSFFAENRSP